MMATGKLSVAYAVVLGLERVLALGLAAVMLNERVNLPQLAGTALVGTGLVGTGIVVLKVNE